MAASVHPAVEVPLGLQAQAPVRLRRAVYVHVSDLTSAYDIDHQKMEEELSRVRKEEGASSTVQQQQQQHHQQHHAEMDTTAYPLKRLNPPRGGFNLCVLVGQVNVVVDKKRVDGSRVRLAEVEVGDETGIVSLRARDEQIDTLQEVSARSGAVVLRNCMLELYQGKHIRLAVTKWGKLTPYPDQVASTPPPPSKINRERNFSRIDLSLVASETENPLGTGSNASGGGSTGGGGGGAAGTGSNTGPGPTKPSSTGSGSGPGSGGQGKRGSGRGGGGGRHQPRNRSGGSLVSQQPKIQQHQQNQSSLAKQGLRYGGGGEPRSSGYSLQQQQQQQQPMHAVHTHLSNPHAHIQPAWQHAHATEVPHQPYPPYATADSVGAQQMLLRQQYEIQQRQLHQMYQQRQQVAGHHHAQQQQLSRTGSFDTQPQTPQQQQQAHHVAVMSGASPLLMPMSGLAPPPLSMHSLEQQQQQYEQYGTDAPLSPNKMNPQAATFAPSAYGHAMPPSAYPELPHHHQHQQQQHQQHPGNTAANTNANSNNPSMPMSYAAVAYEHSNVNSQASNNANPDFTQGSQQQQQQQQSQPHASSSNNRYGNRQQRQHR